MASHSKFKNLLLYGGVSKEDYLDVKDAILEENFKVWKVSSILLAFIAVIVLVMTYIFPNYFGQANRFSVVPDPATSYGICYSSLAIYAIIIAFILHIFGKHHPKVIMPCIALTNIIIVGFFAVISTVLDTQNVSVLFLISIVIASLITVRNPLRASLIVLIGFAVFIALANIFEHTPENLEIFVDDIIYACGFTVLSIIFGFFFNHMRIKNFVLRHYVEEQRDFDSLTKMKSKIAYDREVNQIMDKLYNTSECDPFAVAIFDVNNLKLTNDSYGHEMGDELLIRAANLIQEHFKSSRAYRIGGDEFVVIIRDEDYNDRENIVETFKKDVEEIHKKSSGLKTDTPIACGMATFDPETDVDYLSVFTRADTIMYDNKRKMKETYKKEK